MKFKTTRKAIVSGTPSYYLFQCGYCEMQYLLHYHEPVAYTCGVYGWNFDVYFVNGLTITTGYRNMCGKRIPYEIIRSYETKARKIADDWNIPYKNKQNAIEELLNELCNHLKGDD